MNRNSAHVQSSPSRKNKCFAAASVISDKWYFERPVFSAVDKAGLSRLV